MSKAESLQEQSEAPQQGSGDLGQVQTNTCVSHVGNEKAEMTGRVLMKQRGRPASFPCAPVTGSTARPKEEGKMLPVASTVLMLEYGLM